LRRISDAAKDRRDHVAVLERRDEFGAACRIVPQPVEQLGEAPLGRIHAAAVRDRRQSLPTRNLGDERRFVLRTVIGPEVVIAQRLEILPDGNDRRAGRVDGDRQHVIAVDAAVREREPHRDNERFHVGSVRLRSEIWIGTIALHGILADTCADRSTLAVDERDANALRTVVDARNDRHPRQACRSTSQPR
jgi:hypothetical protein